MPNFVSKDISQLNEFASNNGIRVIVNNITSYNQSDFIGMIRSQNIMSNIDTRYIGNEIRVDVVSKIEQNDEADTPATSNCSQEENKEEDNCLLRDLSGLTKNQVDSYFDSRGVNINITYETITMDMTDYNQSNSGTVTDQSTRVGTKLFNINNGDITLTFMEEFKEENPEEENNPNSDDSTTEE